MTKSLAFYVYGKNVEIGRKDTQQYVLTNLRNVYLYCSSLSNITLHKIIQVCNWTKRERPTPS